MQCEIHLETLPREFKKTDKGDANFLEEHCVTGLEPERPLILQSIWGVTQPQNSKNFEISVVTA